MLTGQEQRISIIGVCGAGKSTLARRIAPLLNLPVIHLDRHCWRPGWQKTPPDEWAAIVKELIARPRWIMDGHYSGTLPTRAEASDAVVFLDLPMLVCLRRVIRRWREYNGRARPDMTEGCPEEWSLDMIHWVVSFPFARRPGLLRMLDDLPDHVTVIRLTSDREVEALVDGIAPRTPSPETDGGRLAASPTPNHRE